MGRYGVQISQQGIDVSRAADYQKVLDSNWKFLDIAVEKDVEATYNNATLSPKLIELATHGLGYVPGFEFMVSSSSRTPFDGSDGIYQFLRADNQKIYLSVYNTGTYTVKGRIRVFTVNIMDEYSAPTYGNNSAAPAASSRYGAKFLDLNKGVGDIEDEDMVPFTLNTRGKQMSIHKHGTKVADSTTGTLTLRHEVGYPPTYMLCRVETKSEWPYPYTYPYSTDQVSGPLVSAYYSAKADPYDIEFKGVQSIISGRFGYVILKDPAEIAG